MNRPQVIPIDSPQGDKLRTARTTRLMLISTEMKGSIDPPKRRAVTPEQAGEILADFIGAKDREHFVVMHLDCKHYVIGLEVVSIGDLSNTIVHQREVFKAAILMNSASIIVGHNHPSGELTPSPDDLVVCNRLQTTGEVLGIPVLDSIIVGGNRWFSLGKR